MIAAEGGTDLHQREGGVRNDQKLLRKGEANQRGMMVSGRLGSPGFRQEGEETHLR